MIVERSTLIIWIKDRNALLCMSEWWYSFRNKFIFNHQFRASYYSVVVLTVICATYGSHAKAWVLDNLYMYNIFMSVSYDKGVH